MAKSGAHGVIGTPPVLIVLVLVLEEALFAPAFRTV
jgi:hypothetical protein